MTIKRYAGDKLVGLSSDTKPTNIPDGATFYETDTLTPFLLVSGSWSEVGGGGAALELYAENPSSPVAPSATGANGVALGREATSPGADSVAIGWNANAQAQTSSPGHAMGRDANVTSGGVAIGNFADATGVYATALGTSADATALNASALGNDAKAAGTSSVAIGKSYTSGTNSFAAAIGNNTSTYGATGANSVAIGQLAKATAANSVAIGDTATSTTANLIALGGTTDTVQISGAYTLPTTDGTNGQVLTTDGSGAVTFADAGGGGAALELYAESIGTGGAVPTTPTADAGGAYNNVAIGNGADIGSGRGESIAIGTDAFTNQSQAIALGKAATVGSGGSFATALGRNSQANGTSATAIGTSYASGTDSFAAAIGNNTSSYGATGDNSVAIGYQAKATGADSVAIGDTAQATNVGAMAFGRDSIASGYTSLALGRLNVASGSSSLALGLQNDATIDRSHAIGYNAKAETRGKFAFAAGSWAFGKVANQGKAQHGLYVLLSDTTDATPDVMTGDNKAETGSADTTNQIILPNNSAYFFSGTIIARQDAATGTDVGAWEIKGAIRREANAASTVLVKSTIDDFNIPTGWAVALTADTTNGGLAITVTGAAATDIRWVATVNTSEVTY